MSDNKVEVVARALRKQEWGHDLWDEVDQHDKAYWHQAARAAIAAMDSVTEVLPKAQKTL